MKASFARRTIGKTPKETHEDQWMPEDRTGSGLNPILAGSGLNWTVIFVDNWRIRTGSDREILDIPM